MAVAQLLLFPSTSAVHLIHNRTDKEEIEHFNIHHEYAGGIDQCQYGGVDCDVNEIDRVLKILLRKSQIEKIDSVASRPARAHDAEMDIIFSSRNDQTEVRGILPVVTCDEGDGGHRCPYFPCPYCHRSRSIYVPESNISRMITCKVEHEVTNQETPVVLGESNSDYMHVITRDEGDGGHRCPYFPCPYCHRSRSIFVPKTDDNIDSPNLECKSNLDTISHAHDTDFNLMRKIDVQSGTTVVAVACPDKGHTCPYFPCPICHRTR